MPELRESATAPGTRINTVRLAEVARRQGGVIGRAQLAECGVRGATLTRWLGERRLHRIHRGVYAVGHTAIAVRGRLVAALLYAGPGSVLSHQTAGWCWGLIEDEPIHVQVSTRRQVASLGAVRVHRRRSVPRVLLNGFAVSPLPRTLLDLAAVLSFAALRRALAEADHRRLLRAHEARAQLGRGRRGAAALRAALDLHWPELALTRSVLEERFLALIEAAGLPRPEVNPRVEGLIVDMLWREHRLVVELDGHASHSSPHEIARDRRRELALRRAGFRVLRYGWHQVAEEPELVISDLRAALSPQPPPTTN